MISNEQLEHDLRAIEGVSEVHVSGDGYHYAITLVSDVFEGQTKVARQRWVYAHLQDYIKSGLLHAVNMTTWTNAEWENNRG